MIKTRFLWAQFLVLSVGRNLLSTNFHRQEVNLNTSEDSEDSGDWGSVSEVGLVECFFRVDSTQRGVMFHKTLSTLLLLSLLNTANRHTSFSFWQHCSNEEILTNTQRARMEIQEIKKVIAQEKPKLKVNKQKVYSFITYLEIECIET